MDFNVCTTTRKYVTFNKVGTINCSDIYRETSMGGIINCAANCFHNNMCVAVGVSSDKCDFCLACSSPDKNFTLINDDTFKVFSGPYSPFSFTFNEERANGK